MGHPPWWPMMRGPVYRPPVRPIYMGPCHLVLAQTALQGLSEAVDYAAVS